MKEVCIMDEMVKFKRLWRVFCDVVLVEWLVNVEKLWVLIKYEVVFFIVVILMEFLMWYV